MLLTMLDMTLFIKAMGFMAKGDICLPIAGDICLAAGGPMSILPPIKPPKGSPPKGSLMTDDIIESIWRIILEADL